MRRERLDGTFNVPKNTISRKEEVRSFGAYFSNSSCVILDNDVWSIVSTNETAPIYARDRFGMKIYRQGRRNTPN